MLAGVGDTLRISVVWKFNGTDEQANVLHARITPDIAGSDAEFLEDLVDYVKYLYQNVMPVVASALIHDRIEVQNVTQSIVFGSLGADPELDGANTSSAAMSPQDTTLIIAPTTISRVQGRIYLPTTVEGEASAGNVGSNMVDGAEVMALRLLSAHVEANGTGFRYVVRLSNGDTVFPFSARVIPQFRTQRRRTTGRGS